MLTLTMFLGIAVFTLWNLFGYIIQIMLMDGEYDINCFNPLYLYEVTDCNVFGVIMLTIFLHVPTPAFAVGYWFCFLCTVGRKE